ncbi:MAG: rod shape-determining protein MreD [Eubacteriales bacterium]|nr:rod shape-determining protein MreD [Eubacteriales bacterium]
MRRTIITAICILLCYIFQTSVFGLFKLADTVPNMMLILVVSIAVMRGQKSGMIVGFFSGLLLDIFYSSYLGIFAFLYMFLGFLDGFFHRIYYSEDTFLPLVLIAVNDVVYGILMYIGYGLLKNHLHIFQYVKRIILPEIVYTVAVALILYRILLRINNALEKYDKGSVDFV